TGISHEGLTPHIKETARSLFYIYMVLTAAQIFILKLVDPGLTWFDIVGHSLSAISSGGFSTYNASAGAFSPAVQWVFIVFMFLAGVNFGLYALMVRRDFRSVFSNSELHFYLFIVLAATTIVLFSVW